MPESWKTPTVVISLVTVSFTTLTFVCTEHKKDEAEKQEIKRNQKEEQKKKDEMYNATLLNESKISIEKRIKELDQEISKLNESLTINAAKCNESRENLERFIEENKLGGGDENKSPNYNKEFDRLDWIYVFNFRDSTNIINKRKAREMEKARFCDSLLYYFKKP